MKNQIQPQQLTQNVFFGPVNSLSRLDFLMENNIKHFVCVDVPTAMAVKYSEKIPLDKYAYNFVNFDSKFNKAEHTNEKLFEIMCFNQNFSSQLFNFIKQTLPSSSDLLNNEIYNMNSLRVLQSNIVTCGKGYERFEVFNDLLTIIKYAKNGNVLVVSSNGNDESLITLLISQVLRENCTADVMDAIKYVKALRPTIHELNLQQIQFFTGFIEYSEKIKSKSWSNIMDYNRKAHMKKTNMRTSSAYDLTQRDDDEEQVSSMQQQQQQQECFNYRPVNAMETSTDFSRSYKRARRTDYD